MNPQNDTTNTPNEPSILTLPQEVFDEIALYLLPKDFLHLCSANHTVWETQHDNPTYWRNVIFTTFRFQFSPLLQPPGNRWYSLCQRLQTETHAFAWGQGVNGELGQPPLMVSASSAHVINGRHQHHPTRDPSTQVSRCDLTDRSWPSQMHIGAEVGKVVDLQCGGWFTALLNTKGEIFMVGAFGSQTGSGFDTFTRLTYPSTKPIRSFSAGRSHILGLDEDGKVWSWHKSGRATEPLVNETWGNASRVVAGWDTGSALTRNGICYWSLRNSSEHGVSRFTFVPGSTPQPAQLDPGQELVGKMVNHIVLEKFVIFLTEASRLFAHQICGIGQMHVPIIELLAFAVPARRMKDIQGSFRNFSVLTDDGKVLRGTQDYVEELWSLRRRDESSGAGFLYGLPEEASDIRRPRDIPALQNTGVISIAYGDHHYHALHEDGRITSYGSESQYHPAFGLASVEEGASLRGVRRSSRSFGRENLLSPVCYQNGRAIWFSDSQKAWLQHLRNCAVPGSALKSMVRVHGQLDAYSQWVEQEGAAWEDGTTGEDGLPSHFTLSVAAGGWHSAALVVRNDTLVKEVDRSWRNTDGNYVWSNEGAPRIRLPDGFEMPGSEPLRDWKGGMQDDIELDFAAADFNAWANPSESASD